MTRITSTILVVLILLNGSVTVMEASGLSDDIGVELAPGISDRMESLTETMREGFQPGTGVVESLLSVIIAAGQLFTIVIQATYVVPTAMINIGFPSWLVTAFFAPAYLLSTLELVFLLGGRDMI